MTGRLEVVLDVLSHFRRKRTRLNPPRNRRLHGRDFSSRANVPPSERVTGVQNDRRGRR